MSYLPYFKTNETFRNLWLTIPEVLNYEEYISLLNEIDNERIDRFITETEENVLIQALEIYMEIRRIKKEEG